MSPHTTLQGGVYNPHSSNHKSRPPTTSQTGIILGIVFAVVGSLLMIGVGWFMVLRRRRKEKAPVSEFEPSIHASFRVSTIPEVVDEKSREEHASLEDHPLTRASSTHSQVSPGSSQQPSIPSGAPTPSPSHSSLRASVHTTTPSHSSIHSLVPSQTSTHATQISSVASPSHPAMTLLSQSQPTPRQSSETARGSFECPPWNRDSRFQEFF